MVLTSHYHLGTYDFCSMNFVCNTNVVFIFYNKIDKHKWKHLYHFDSQFCFIVTDLPAPISVCPSRTVQADLVGRISSPGFPVPNQGVQLNCTLTVKKPAAMKLVLRREIVMLKCKHSEPSKLQNTPGVRFRISAITRPISIQFQSNFCQM